MSFLETLGSAGGQSLTYILMNLLGIGGQAAGGYMTAKAQLKAMEKQAALQEWIAKQDAANAKSTLDLNRLGLLQSGQQFNQSLGLKKQEFGLAKNAQQFQQRGAMPGLLASYAALGRRV